MFSVYLRCKPQQARHFQHFKHAVEEAAKAHDNDTDIALKVMPAKNARALAVELFAAELVTPPNLDRVLPEDRMLERLELERLQHDAAVYRQRLEELRSAARRERERAARDLAAAAEERDDLGVALLKLWRAVPESSRPLDMYELISEVSKLVEHD